MPASRSDRDSNSLYFREHIAVTFIDDSQHLLNSTL